VAKVAHLACLEVAQSRLESLTDELNNILGWIETLSEVNTDQVEPMTSVVETNLHWRQDEVSDGNYPDQVLANAPEAQYGFFAVPKVIE
jgi:aspartyl-tRNA(Asn)/glutamyl-tRNA(Gln) amidotransferase subunit C